MIGIVEFESGDFVVYVPPVEAEVGGRTEHGPLGEKHFYKKDGTYAGIAEMFGVSAEQAATLTRLLAGV